MMESQMTSCASRFLNNSDEIAESRQMHIFNAEQRKKKTQ